MFQGRNRFAKFQAFHDKSRTFWLHRVNYYYFAIDKNAILTDNCQDILYCETANCDKEKSVPKLIVIKTPTYQGFEKKIKFSRICRSPAFLHVLEEEEKITKSLFYGCPPLSKFKDLWLRGNQRPF